MAPVLDSLILPLAEGLPWEYGAPAFAAMAGVITALWVAWRSERRGRAGDNARWLDKYEGMHNQNLERERASTKAVTEGAQANRALEQVIRDTWGE